MYAPLVGKGLNFEKTTYHANTYQHVPAWSQVAGLSPKLYVNGVPTLIAN